jgi:hypothetical protein
LIFLANVLVALVAALHIYFLILEMFLWTKPLGLKTFRQPIEKATSSAVLAANQGLYNGFLAAGLIWGLIHGTPAFAWRGHRQQADPVRAGAARSNRAAHAVFRLRPPAPGASSLRRTTASSTIPDSDGDRCKQRNRPST